MVSRLEKLMQKSKGTGWLAKIPYAANRPLGLIVGLSNCEGSFPAFLSSNYLLFFLQKLAKSGIKYAVGQKLKVSDNGA